MSAQDTTAAEPGLRLSFSEQSMVIETQSLTVGVSTASGLKVWGVDSTNIEFSGPRRYTDTLPEKLRERDPRALPQSFFLAVYSRSHERPAMVPTITYFERLPDRENENAPEGLA